jgi:hypothetical protein
MQAIDLQSLLGSAWLLAFIVQFHAQEILHLAGRGAAVPPDPKKLTIPHHEFLAACNPRQEAKSQINRGIS